jgi:hypothetical protein
VDGSPCFDGAVNASSGTRRRAGASTREQIMRCDKFCGAGPGCGRQIHNGYSSQAQVLAGQRNSRSATRAATIVRATCR